MFDVAIIGGGMAGLCAANRLIDHGKRVVLIEEKVYPAHRVCGEFYSPECVSALTSWGVDFPVTMTRAQFYAGSFSCSFPLRAPALGISRARADELLAARIKRSGATVLDGERVVNLSPLSQGSGYDLELVSGEHVSAAQVIIATGRHSVFAQKQWKPFTSGPMPFLGLKMHFSGIAPSDTVHMHALDGGYIGISSIEDGKTNVAALVKTALVQKAGGPEMYMQKMLQAPHMHAFSQILQSGTPLFARWLTCGIPPFGKRNTPSRPGIYYVGDVAGAITPICGDGLGMAVTSGIMAADYAIKHDAHGFERAWRTRYADRLRWGSMVQRLMLSLPLAKTGIWLSARFPQIPRALFSITREW